MTEINSIERDVLIIGGGPAGLSASLWCADMGLRSVVLDRSPELGGQLLRIYNPIKNHIGFETENGRELSGRFLESFKHVEHEHFVGIEIADLDIDSMSLTIADNRRFIGRAIVAATGVRRRSLGVEGETRFAGKGILDSGARQRKSAAGKRVAVIGGADAAVENALMLAEFAEKVILIHRGPELTAREEFVRRVIENPRIETRFNAVVRGFSGDQSLDTIELLDRATETAEDIAVDLAVIRIGVTPNSELLRGKIELDEAGYAFVNSHYETSASAVYAIGDLSNPTAPTISGAVGSAATAVKSVNAYFAARRFL
ncbi:MAG: NAD(P)/FAD-dependent oxidoreductase [Acidobacteriota bacterium]